MTDAQQWQPPTGYETPPVQHGERTTPDAPTNAPAVPGPPGWTPPPKPGLIPLRPLGFGTLIWAPFQVLRRNPKATFGSALLVQSVTTLVSLVVVGLVAFFAASRVADAALDERAAVEAGASLTIVLSAIVPIALLVVASALLQGIIVIEVARGTLGERLRLAALWKAAGRRLWVLVVWTFLLGLALLAAIAIVGGLVVLLVVLGDGWLPLAIIVGVLGGLAIIAAAFWLYTKTSLAPSLIILERVGIRAAVVRSWSLTGGYFWRTLGVQLLVATIVNVVAQVVTAPLSILFGVAVSLVDPNATIDAYVPAGILYVLTLFVALVLGAVAAVVQSATTALIYVDLRMRKEGLDLDLQRFVEAAQTGGRVLPDPFAPRRPAAPAGTGTSAGPFRA